VTARSGSANRPDGIRVTAAQRMTRQSGWWLPVSEGRADGLRPKQKAIVSYTEIEYRNLKNCVD
jgi:hypothetical protein